MEQTEDRQSQSDEYSSLGSDEPRRRRGRPKGSKNKPRPVVEAPMTRCIKCKSTELEWGRIVNELDYVGEHHGQPYDHSKWQNAKCLNCGQFQRVIKRFYKGNQVA